MSDPMTGISGRIKTLTVTWVMAAMACGVAGAQTPYPAKPIRFIVPYAAGGGGDIVSRALGDGITKMYGQPVLVENRVGAGSNIGSVIVAKAEPDGYTLLLGSNGNAVNAFLYASMPYDPVKELTPIYFVGRSPSVLLASPTTSFKTVQDIVAQHNAKTMVINFASGGIGTSEHLAQELFKRRAGIAATHVPYKGFAAVVPDLVSGRVHLAMGPGGMQPALVQQANAMLNAVASSPEFLKRFESLGGEKVGGTPQQANDYFRGEMATWGEIIKAQNIRAE